MIKSLSTLVAFLCLGPPALPPASPVVPEPAPQVAILKLPPEILEGVPGGRAVMMNPALAASDACVAPPGPTVKLDPQFKARLAGLIKKYAQKHGIDEKLVRLVLQAESGGNPQAVSPKGAQGLMQLMPETAASLGVRDAFDPEENVAGGVKYLKHCLTRFKQDVVLALAAYNAGPNAVEKYKGVPPYQETENYVASITKAYTGKPWTKEEPEAAEAPAAQEETGLAWNVPTPTWKIGDPRVRVSAPRWKEKSPELTQDPFPSTSATKFSQKFRGQEVDEVYRHIRATVVYSKIPDPRHLARSDAETNSVRILLPPVRSTEKIP